MTLAAGTCIGPYEIIGAIGAGGMGEVYRGRDTRLNRDVAIKTLPAHFAADRERLARFEREAQSLAALNHPHIAQIYGVTDAPPALVMELVEGEDLSQRIAAGKVPVPEALHLAMQIAEALECAHERGIVHRDLKPGNIKINDTGSVKVLDFGLAKMAHDAAMAGSGSAAGLAPPMQDSPTFTSPAMTQLGVILGTAAYMAPEQAKGKAVDRRADVWAFGSVLYEMLTGKRAFEGEDVTDVIAAIMRSEPDWTALPPDTPPAVRKLLRRCFDKDRAKRLDSMAVARYEIQEALTEPPTPAVPISSRRRSSALPIIAAGALCATVAAVATWLAVRPRESPAPLIRGSLTPVAPDVLSLDTFLSDIDISPDGTMIAFNGQRQGHAPQIFVRRLDQDVAVPLAGTEDGRGPTFSDDGQWISYRSANEVLKIAVTGGAPQVLCRRCAGGLRGVTWLNSGEFVFTTPGGLGGLRMLRPGAAESEPITNIDRDAGDRSHLYPHALPGGRAILFTIESTNEARRVAVFNPQMKTTRTLMPGASSPKYSSGHLFYVATGKVYAVPFDAQRLEVRGVPVAVLDGLVTKTSGSASYAVAREGTLAYVAGPEIVSTFSVSVARRDRTRETLPTVPGTYIMGRFSPNGEQAALDSRSGDLDLWIWEFTRRVPQRRLTFSTASDAYPVWSHDGKEIFYSTPTKEGWNILRRNADGTGEPQHVTSADTALFGTAFTPDSQTLIAHVPASSLTLRQGVYTVRVSGEAKPQLLIPGTDGNAINAHLSRDGKWIVYQLEKGNRSEIIVHPFPNIAGGRWQVSDWGSHPVFSARDDELFFRDRDRRLMSMKVRLTPLFAAELPTVILENVFAPGPNRAFDVSPDGQRFLLIDETRFEQGTGRPPQLNFVLNWTTHVGRVVRAR